MSELLRVQNVSAGYGQKEFVHNVSFVLEPHTLTGLLGPNGCGKTTLIRCIINQLAHSGSCVMNGTALEALKPRQLARQVSYIPQRSGMSISMPVLDVVLMGFNPLLKLLEHPGRKHRAAAMSALDRVCLAEYANKDFQTLSEGQKQLALIARVMVEDTALLVLDEPDSALDFQNRFQILSLVRDMVQQQDKAGLLCLHDPALALEFCHQILLMKDGEVLHVLRPREDAVSEMEAAMRDIYGAVSLVECTDRCGTQHLTLLWEGKT